jgi:ribosomal protein S18 acetylase RimI-like enzyme
MAKPLELRPFSDDDLAAAGALLAARHRGHRLREPLLPERYEREDEATAAVEDAWRKPGATGAAAEREGRLVGYLIGAPDDPGSWGADEWIDHPGHAAEEPEVLRDLYAALADEAVRDARGRHYVLVPASDPDVLDAWYRLGFGQQQAYGIREVQDEPWPQRVREAAPDEVEGLLPLTIAISRHHAGSPVFSDNAARRVEGAEASKDDVRVQLEADIAADEIATLVAEVDGRIVGFLEACAVELSGEGVDGHATLARPDGACYLAFAATDPEARGLGTGVELTSAAFAWAHRAGYSTMVTDWRVPNLLASRFWPRRGFRTTFLRLYRSIP